MTKEQQPANGDHLMKRPRSLQVSLAALSLAFALPAAYAQTADVPGVTEHIANATKAAKTDLLGPLGLCKTETPATGPGFRASSHDMEQKPPLETAQRL